MGFWFGKTIKTHVYFHISNIEQRYKKDMHSWTKLENAMPEAGAMVVRGDWPKKELIVMIYDKKVKPKDLLNVVKKHKYKATIKNIRKIPEYRWGPKFFCFRSSGKF